MPTTKMIKPSLKLFSLALTILGLFPIKGLSQNITYSKGEFFKIERGKSRMIGENQEFVFYEFIPEASKFEFGSSKNFILKYNKGTLDLISKVKLSFLKKDEWIVNWRISDNTLQMLTLTESTPNMYTIRLQTLNLKTDKNNTQILDALLLEKIIYLRFLPDRPVIEFMHSQGIYEYDLEGNRIGQPLKHPKPPADIKLKTDYISPYLQDGLKSTFGTDPKDVKYFYPVNQPNGLHNAMRYYIETAFRKNDQLDAIPGFYNSLSIFAYDSLIKNNLYSYEFDLMEGYKILDFDCYLMTDGNILITGIFEGKKNDSESEFGVFSKIISSSLKDITKSKYKVIIPYLYKTKANIQLDPQYELLFRYSGINVIHNLKTSDGEHYYLCMTKYACAKSDAINIISIDKNSGEIKITALQHKLNCESQLFNYENALGISKANKLLIVYQDHDKNIEKAYSDTTIYPLPFKADEMNLVYISYDSTGFSNKNLILKCKDEDLIIFEPGGLDFTRYNGSSNEIFILGFDERQNKGRLYKFTLSGL